jgi:hypothetical protein
MAKKKRIKTRRHAGHLKGAILPAKNEANLLVAFSIQPSGKTVHSGGADLLVCPT